MWQVLIDYTDERPDPRMIETTTKKEAEKLVRQLRRSPSVRAAAMWDVNAPHLSRNETLRFAEKLQHA